MIKIYHNPKCSKSRCGLAVLKESNKDYEVIDYMKHPLTESALRDIIAKLGIAPMDLVRTKESVWKEQFKEQPLTDDQIIAAMLEYPQLIERPIVVIKDKAIIGRPTERIIEFVTSF
ncbi:arsenate reductase [Capnocytophaga haemolytica]|uniref:Arsenate reductase n=1 Tax=Capnocytophaga haemolytica TaxID=45243 RepID=A0ABN4KFL4_9FLAO|nr:arsenate reductase (glutaredoxin) [Capnocytophaga haemolytica]AMD86246.1 arsenate reductase [Capnocytophaga haemolytica]